MSKKYRVRIPLAGVMAINVEAENEEEAQQKAFASVWSVDITANDNNVELDEIDMYEEIVSGNILHAPLNEVEIEESSF